MRTGCANPQHALALASRLAEAAALVAEASERLADLRKSLPGMPASAIYRQAEELQKSGAALGRLVAEVKRLHQFILRGSSSTDNGRPAPDRNSRRLEEVIAGFPDTHRREATAALAVLREKSAAFRKTLASFGYVAGTHLVYLNALLRFIGEAAGLEVTYHPRRPAMPSASMGLVDKLV